MDKKELLEFFEEEDVNYLLVRMEELLKLYRHSWEDEAFDLEPDDKDIVEKINMTVIERFLSVLDEFEEKLSTLNKEATNSEVQKKDERKQ